MLRKNRYQKIQKKPVTDITEKQIIENVKQVESKNKLQPFKWQVVARSKWGKTVLVFEKLKEMVKKGLLKPHRIFLFSQNVKSDPSQLDFIDFVKKTFPKFKELNCKEYVDMPLIQKIYKENKFLKENAKKYHHYCFLFDDQASEEILKDKAMEKLMTQGRHYFLNVILLVQFYKGNMKPSSRDQFTNVLLGSLNSQHVIEDILQGFSSNAGETKKEALKKMVEHYQQAIQTRDNHGFLHIATEKKYGDKRISQNFDDIYYDKHSNQDLTN